MPPSVSSLDRGRTGGRWKEEEEGAGGERYDGGGGGKWKKEDFDLTVSPHFLDEGPDGALFFIRFGK